jgi:WD40 repeat protein
MLQTKLRLLVNTSDCPVSADISHCGQWLAVGDISGRICLYDLATGKEALRWKGHARGIHRVSWNPQSLLLATGGQDNHIRLWQFDGHDKILILESPISKVPGCWVENIKWMPDGKLLAVTGGKQLALFSVAGSITGCHHFRYSTIADICWHPTLPRIALAGYGGVEIVNTLNIEQTPKHLARSGSVLSINWSPDAKVLAAGCQDNAVHFWCLDKGNNAGMAGYNNKPVQIVWSKNSRKLVTGGREDLVIWPFDKKGPEGRRPGQIAWHEQAISALAVRSASPFLISGCRGGAIAVWRNIGDHSPATSVFLTSRIEHLIWSSYNRIPLFVAVSRDGTIGVWDIIDSLKNESKG